MLTSEIEYFRVVAPDAGRPDAAQIVTALSQLQGRAVDLALSLTPLALDVRCGAPGHDSAYVSGVVQQLYPGGRLEPDTESDGAAPAHSAALKLRLSRPLCFPLRTWQSFVPADPVAALSGAARQLLPGEQLESQLVLQPWPVTWQPVGRDPRFPTPFSRLLTSGLAVPLLMIGLPVAYLMVFSWMIGGAIAAAVLFPIVVLCLAGVWLVYRHL
jgi:hypothetical protein